MNEQPPIEGKNTILLVDDDEQVRHITKILLTFLGYTVLVAKDGAEAICIFSQYHVDILCVISDLTMPNMDGIQTLKALRKISPEIPAILSSGFTDDTKNFDVKHSYIFLQKPYKVDELQRALTKAIETEWR